MGNGIYVYKEEDFPDEDSYQKKKLASFINNLGILEAGFTQRSLVENI